MSRITSCLSMTMFNLSSALCYWMVIRFTRQTSTATSSAPASTRAITRINTSKDVPFYQQEPAKIKTMPFLFTGILALFMCSYSFCYGQSNVERGRDWTLDKYRLIETWTDTTSARMSIMSKYDLITARPRKKDHDDKSEKGVR